jgi:hypothetical protein
VVIATSVTMSRAVSSGSATSAWTSPAVRPTVTTSAPAR